MTYQAEISYDRASGKFISKVPVFTSYDEAVLYSEQLADRSSMIADYRVTAVMTAATHTFVGEKLRCIGVEE